MIAFSVFFQTLISFCFDSSIVFQYFDIVLYFHLFFQLIFWLNTIYLSFFDLVSVKFVTCFFSLFMLRLFGTVAILHFEVFFNPMNSFKKMDLRFGIIWFSKSQNHLIGLNIRGYCFFVVTSYSSLLLNLTVSSNQIHLI